MEFQKEVLQASFPMIRARYRDTNLRFRKPHQKQYESLSKKSSVFTILDWRATRYIPKLKGGESIVSIGQD